MLARLPNPSANWNESMGSHLPAQPSPGRWDAQAREHFGSPPSPFLSKRFPCLPPPTSPNTLTVQLNSSVQEIPSETFPESRDPLTLAVSFLTTGTFVWDIVGAQ